MQSKTFYFFPFFLLIPFFLFSQKISTGLKFTDPGTLKGIPLASTPFSGQNLPSSVDLSANMPPPGHQGNQNSCVGWAVAYAVKSYQEKVEFGHSLTRSGRVDYSKVFSPAFVYNQINNGVDGGSYFTDALNVVSQQGVATWEDMPYSDDDYRTRPSSSQKQQAKAFTIDFWRQVNIADIKEVKAQVNAGYPVLIGASVDDAFVDDGYGVGSRPYIWDSFGGGSSGGHAMAVVGYDDRYNAFKVINSWGQDWGNAGYCWIDYDFFPRAVREGYVMKDAITETDFSPQPSNPNPQVNNPQVNNPQQTTYDDYDFVEFEEWLQEYHDWYLNSAQFSTSNVLHNMMDPTYGATMQFHGEVYVPGGVGSNYQIAIFFYYNDGYGGKGQAVGSLSPYFSLPDGSAATATQITRVGRNGVNVNWSTFMPYNYLNCARGQYDMWGNYQAQRTYLIAEPVLYIDNFAVQTGDLIPFYVQL